MIEAHEKKENNLGRVNLLLKKIFGILKDWLWAIVLAVVALVTLSKPDRWVKGKEKEIKQREKENEKAEQDAEQHQAKAEELDKIADELYERYKEAVEKHDREIAEAGQKKEPDDEPIPFDDPDSAAKFLDDLLNDIGDGT